MRLLRWIAPLLPTLLGAQVNTPLVERFFLPVQSYRLASTASLMEGDLERMLDPATAGTLQGRRIYTALSDLFLSDRLVGNVSSGRWTGAGLGGSVFGITPVGLGVFHEGAFRDADSGSSEFVWTDGEVRSVRRHASNLGQTRTYALLLGGVQPGRGLYLLHTSDGNIEASSSRTLEEHISPMPDNPSFTLASHDSARGQHAQDLWALMGGLALHPGLRLTGGIAFRQTTYQYTTIRSRNFSTSERLEVRTQQDRRAYRWNAFEVLLELRWDRSTSRSEGTGRAGLIWRLPHTVQKNTDREWFQFQGTIETDTAGSRSEYTSSAQERGVRSRLGGFLAWSQRYPDPRYTFALGAAIEGWVESSRIQQTGQEQWLARRTDGDGIPGDADDYTDILKQHSRGNLRIQERTLRIHLPVAVELHPWASLPIQIRMGARFSLAITQDQTIRTTTSSGERRIENDAGYVVVDPLPPSSSRAWNVQYRLRSSTRFTYGAAFSPSEHLEIEIMHFARLTALETWQISVLWKP